MPSKWRSCSLKGQDMVWAPPGKKSREAELGEDSESTEEPSCHHKQAAGEPWCAPWRAAGVQMLFNHCGAISRWDLLHRSQLRAYLCLTCPGQIHLQMSAPCGFESPHERAVHASLLSITASVSWHSQDFPSQFTSPAPFCCCFALCRFSGPRLSFALLQHAPCL